ncbi:MAG: hypothetical protein K2I68_03715, partial [Bacteroidales bacterium]|nr:hypothetical protein [Bacteroidales bacterium]
SATASTHVSAGLFNGTHTAEIDDHNRIDTVCGNAGLILTITSENAGGTPKYRWYVNGTAVPGNNRPTFATDQLPDSGRFQIYAEVESSEKCVSPEMAVTQTVTIDRLPVPRVDAGPDMRIECGGVQILSGSWIRQTVGPYTYEWRAAKNLLDSTEVITDITMPVISRHLFQTTKMTLAVTDANGCTGTDEMIIIAPCGELTVVCNQLPKETAICLGDSTTLEALPQGGSGHYNFAWSVVSGDAASMLSATNDLTLLVRPNQTTVYRFTLTDTETDQVVTCERTVQVDQPSIGGTATVQPASDFCADAELLFNVTDYRGNKVEWEMNTDAGNLDGWALRQGYQGAPVKMPVEDTFYFRAFVTNGVCPGAYSEPVYVTPYAPIYNNQILPDVQQMCRDNNSGANFEGLTVFGGMTEKYTYRWEYKNAKTGNNWMLLPTPNDGKDYTLPTLTDDSTYVRRVVNDSVCDRSSNTVLLSFYPKAKAGVLKPVKDSVCHHEADTLYLPETASFDIVEWEESHDGITWKSASFSGYPGVVRSDEAGVTVYYRAIVNHTDRCEADTSTVAKIKFRTAFDLTLEFVQPDILCDGTAAQFVAVTNHIDIAPTFTWYHNGKKVQGQTGDTLKLDLFRAGDSVRCIAVCADMCADNGTIDSTFHPTVRKPDTKVTASTTLVCGTETVQLHATGTGIVAYNWLHSGETTANVSVTVWKKQEYTVTTVDANGCLDTASVEIKVEPELTVGNDTTICHGATPQQWAHLTFQCDNYTKLLWKNLQDDNDTTSILKDWFVSPEETTRYALSVSNTRADGTVCTAHDTVTVYVRDTVTPQITIHRIGYPTTDTTVVPECGGMEARFIAETKYAGAHPRYQWTINGRDIKGATDSVFVTHDLTNFCYVRCRLISDEMCSTADEVWSNIVIVKIVEKNRVMIDINANTGTD